MVHATPETVVGSTPEYQSEATVRHISTASPQEYLEAIAANHEEVSRLHDKGPGLWVHGSSHDEHTFLGSRDNEKFAYETKDSDSMFEAEEKYPEHIPTDADNPRILPLPTRKTAQKQNQSRRHKPQPLLTRGFSDGEQRDGDDAVREPIQTHMDLADRRRALGHLAYMQVDKLRRTIESREKASAEPASSGRKPVRGILDEQEPPAEMTQLAVDLELETGEPHTTYLDKGAGHFVVGLTVDHPQYPASRRRGTTRTRAGAR